MNGTGGDSKHGDGLAAAKDVARTPISPSSPKSPAKSTSVEDLTTQVLHFLSTASTETIAGIAVGLAACTYLVLGRIGLVLIGVLGGVVLHATWEGGNSASGSAQDVRREKGLDIVKRLLDLRELAEKEGAKDTANDAIGNSFEAFQPETGAALNELVDAVIRDYVKWWYQPIIPKDQSFPAAARQTLTKFILAVSSHLSRKRPADTFLDFLTNSSSIVIVFLNELTGALAVTPGSNPPPAEAVYAYLSQNPESNLANVLNTKQQSKKFKMIAEDILQNFLEKSTYDCDPAKVFLKEILAGIVLEMSLENCSKPEWINGWIVYLLEDGEPDISQAIDEGMTTNGLTDTSFDIDGNLGNMGVAKSSKSQVAKQEEKRHRKRLSKAEEAMEEAMEEAKRLSQLIAEEDAKNLRSRASTLEFVPTLSTRDAPQPRLVPEMKSAVSSISTTPQIPVTPPDTRTSNGKPQEAAITSAEQSPISGEKAVLPASPPNATLFTSFDQIVPQSTPVPLQSPPQTVRRQTLSLTLHNANIIIHDDSTAMDKGKIRNKPTGDYLVQIEPASSKHPGWMIVRRYTDFETLHEVLRRIAQISGVIAFAEQHNTLPSWKEHTKGSLRGELERYLRDACWYQPLAESEGMKRFLEKDNQGQSFNSNQKTGFPGLGWANPSAFENMGKGVLDVLTSAPKGVAEGGKAIGGGITGVFTNIGNLGQKKPNGNSSSVGVHTSGRASTSTLPRMDSASSISGSRKSRVSEDSLRAPIVHTQPSKIPPMERRPSYNSIVEEDSDRQPRESSARSSMSGRRSATHSRDGSRAPSRKGTPLSSPIQGSIEEVMSLPPPPSEIDDHDAGYLSRTSTSTAQSQHSPGRPSLSIPRRPSIPVGSSPQTATPTRKPRKEVVPLTEQETRVAVELLFAVINELYTLSSAWNIRRTLLGAAKTFLLRPGNPSLSSIQSLIQDSIIASNTSDSGIAAHLRKIRENALPTEEERKAWPVEMSAEEKERLRIKARKLLVERAIPAALTGVMGQATSAEAMGKVFDCLQLEEVARGLVFGLLLQGVRAITH